MQDSLGDRQKRYESASRYSLTPRMPVILRLDGKAFHTYTARFPRPFDTLLQNVMVNSAQQVADEIQGFKVGYTQSDEVSLLLTDYDTLQTSAWFDYDLQKLVSVSASLMTGFFNRNIVSAIEEYNDAKNVDLRRYGEKMETYRALPSNLAFFDSRAFNVPKEDVVNYFLFRAKDWERNLLTMYCSSFFSHRELHGKSCADRHEMLHSIGKNWATDVNGRSKSGTFFTVSGKAYYPPATYDALSQIIHKYIHCDTVDISEPMFNLPPENW
jgi:tRNA(His) guanylyltransferase